MIDNSLPIYLYDTELMSGEEQQNILQEIARHPFIFEVDGIHASHDGISGIPGSRFLDRPIMMSGSDDMNDNDPLRETIKMVVEKFCTKHNLKLTNYLRMRTNITFPSLDQRGTHPHVDLRNRFKHYVFIYYVNDSDGDTVMFTLKADGNVHTQEELIEFKRFAPAGGGVLLFDADYFHTWEHPLRANYRCIMLANIQIELP
jgi:hypothetical protein